MSKIKNKIRDVDDSICNQCLFSIGGLCCARENQDRFTDGSIESWAFGHEPEFPRCLPIENFEKVKLEGL